MRNILLILTLFASFAFSREVSAQQTVILKTDTITIDCASSDTILVPVRVFNFDSIGSFQFTLMWDTAKLDYVHTTPLNPAFLGSGIDVGFDTTTFINQGKLTFIWTSSMGTSAPDSSVVFSVAFRRIGGSFAPLMFVNSPTVIEVTDVNAEPLPVMTMTGGVEPIDTLPPAITCPANVTVQGPGSATVNGIAPAGITDNCAPVANVGWASAGASVISAPDDPDASGATFNVGLSTVTYTATDVGGNTATCSFTVTVELSISSDSLTIIAQNAMVSCNQSLSIDITALNFDSLGSLQFSIGWNPAVLGFVSVGNFNPALQLTIADFNTTQALSNGLLSFLWTTNASEGTSLPPGAVLFSINLDVLGGGGVNSGMTFGDVPAIREAISNASGSPEEIPALWINGTVNVTDNVPPTIECPSNVSVDLPPGNSNVQVNGLQPLSLLDDCGGNVGLSYALTGATTGQGQGNANGNYNPGVTTVTYTAADQSGNTSTCSFTVTVNAAGALTLILDSVAVDCQSSGAQVAVNVYVENWDDIVGLQFGVNWDETVLQFDTVDNDFPGLNLSPGDFNFINAPNGTFLFFGGGLGSNWPQIPDGGVFFTIYFNVLNSNTTSNIEFTGFIEAINGSVNVVPVVTVNGFFQPGNDVNPPIVTCPANITVDAFGNECNANVNVPLPDASDACSGIDSIVQSPPGNVFNAGTTLVLFTVTDSAGNSAVCSLTVTVIENIPPQIVCPSNITADAPGFSCQGTVDWTDPLATDACGQLDLVITSNYTQDSIFPVGQTIVLYMVTDASGNTASCSFLVVIEDTLAPFLTCPDDFTVAPNGPGCTATVPFAVSADDNCDPDVTLSGSAASNDIFQPGTTTVTFTAIDDFNNSASCVFDVTVLDNVPPELICPDDIFLTTAPDTCGAFATWADLTATDNCSASVTPTSPFNSGDYFGVGTTAVVYTATDGAGNSVACSFQVIVTESVPPIILGCPADVVVSLPPVDCDTVIFWDEPFATDNCLFDTMVTTAQPGSLFQAGTTIVTYTAYDAAGNTSVCTFSIFLYDQIAPVLSNCPQNITISDVSPCGQVVDWPAPTATDNCTPQQNLVLTVFPLPGSVFFNGTTEVVYYVEDASGNFDSCTFEVKINASTPPGFINFPANQTFSGCSAVATWTAPEAVGFCMLDLVTSNYQSGDTFPLGTTTVIYTAVDSSGFTQTATFTITVTDDESPQIGCPEGPIVVNVGGGIVSDPDEFLFSTDTVAGCDGVELEFDLPQASDNCGLESFGQTAGQAAGEVFPPGLDSLLFVAVDFSGNSMECVVVIEVLDLPALVLTSAPDLGCLNDTVIITATPIAGATYTWTGPQGQFPTTNQVLIPSFATANEGTYTASASINGCEVPAGTITLDLATAPDAVDDTDFVIQPGTTDTFNILLNDTLIPPSDFSITDVSDLTGLVNLGNGLFSYTSPEEGDEVSFLYEVCSNSCPNLCDMALVTIKIRNDEDCSFIPNIITPNGDEANDWLEIPCLNFGLFRDNSLVIYNQWGDKVYEITGYDNDDPDRRWEGTLDGQPGKDLPDGVYFYVFRPGPNEPVIKGFVEIFR